MNKHRFVFCVLKGHRSKFLNFDIFLSLKIVLILANSVDHDEISQFILVFFTVCQSTFLQVSGVKRNVT